MAPAAYFAKAAKAKERGPTEKKWEVKRGRREEIVNVKVNVNEKAKGERRKSEFGPPSREATEGAKRKKVRCWGV